MSISPNIVKGVFFCFLLLPLAGCGGKAFEAQFEEPPAPEKAVTIDDIENPPERNVKPVIVGVGGKPKELFAWDLEAHKMIWSIPMEARSIPVVAGDLVIIHEKRGIVARHLTNGREAMDLGDDALLVGADSDGEFTVISLKMGADSNPRGVLVGAEGGRKKWTNDLKLPVGVPAVTNGVVVVPWASHRISLLHARSGNEQTRYQLNDTIMGQAFVDEGAVFIGHHGVFRLNKKIQDETVESMKYYEPLARSFPGQPLFIRDGYEPVPAPDDIWIRSRLLWKLKSQEESLGLEDSTLYFLHHRFVFALAADADELKWIYQSPDDLVGAAVQAGSVTLVTVGGQIVVIEAETGLQLSKTDMGFSGIQAASVRLGEFKMTGEQSAKPEPLREQITDVIEVNEEKLAGGAAFAVRFLRQFKEAEVTEQLVKICSSVSAHPPLRAAACKTLGERTTGPGPVREALKKRGSFLKGTHSPPSGALSLAAANIGIQGAIPDILAHLWDPTTPVTELGGILEGLGKLGGKKAGDACDKFLRLYHAGTNDKRLVGALGKAAEALVAIKKKDARSTLDYISDDKQTPSALKETITKLLASLAEPKEVEKESKKEKKVEDKRPERITEKMVKKLFKPIEKKLKKCIPENSTKIKINLLVDPSGEIKSFSTSPDSAKECAKKHLDKKSLPETKKEESERIVYVINK